MAISDKYASRAEWDAYHRRVLYGQKIFVAAKNAGKIIPKPFANGCKQKNGKPRIEAHHENYDRPLDVVWLCSKCHSKRHTEMRRLGTRPTATIDPPLLKIQKGQFSKKEYTKITPKPPTTGLRKWKIALRKERMKNVEERKTQIALDVLSRHQ